MRKATRKISGPQMERFFRHYFAQEPGLESAAAESLTRRSLATFSSVNVRKEIVLGGRGVMRRIGARRQSDGEPAPAAAVAPAGGTGGFDPYVFGLVPTFQREGREGLLARLGGIADVGQLRQMARAQQISLPAELRTGEAGADALRGAIADAVEKRIADRRAAAGGKE